MENIKNPNDRNEKLNSGKKKNDNHLSILKAANFEAHGKLDANLNNNSAKKFSKDTKDSSHKKIFKKNPKSSTLPQIIIKKSKNSADSQSDDITIDHNYLLPPKTQLNDPASLLACKDHLEFNKNNGIDNNTDSFKKNDNSSLISWINDCLPLYDSKPDTDKKYITRMNGENLNRAIAEHYSELGMYDFRILLRHILKLLGIPYNAASHRKVPIRKVAEILKNLGMSTKSEIMNMITNNLIWYNDNFVSFARLIDFAGKLDEDYNTNTLLSKITDSVDKEIKVKKQSYEILANEIASERLELEKIVASAFPMTELVKKIKNPRRLSSGAINLIAEMFDSYLKNKINANEFLDNVRKVTNCVNLERLNYLLDEYSAPPSSESKSLFNLKFQQVLVAILKDIKDLETGEGKNSSSESLSSLSENSLNKYGKKRLKNKSNEYLSPITHQPLKGTGVPTSCALCAPTTKTIRRINDILLKKKKLSKYLLEDDIRFLQELCGSFANGWVSTVHFKTICDIWQLTLNEFLGRAIKEHESLGRCSVRDVWKGILFALSDNGIVI